MFRLAKISDKERIINFIMTHWDRDHVYVRYPRLFEHDFIRNSDLTMGLMEIDEEIKGIFGYFFYNRKARPDIGGMLWKVTDDANRIAPLPGINLRKFVLDNVKHRFFGAPGAGLQTKPIYELLGCKWHELRHYVGTLSHQFLPKKISFEGGILEKNKKKYKTSELKTLKQLKTVNSKIFLEQTPEKDFEYLNWRYSTHPYNNYKIWLVNYDHCESLVITRFQKIYNKLIMRIVDYIGSPELAASSIYSVFLSFPKNLSLAYVDFVASGFDNKQFLKHGFAEIDFNNPINYAPNLFEPLVEKSVQVFANSYHGYKHTVMVRGNGDQDRPNLLQISTNSRL